MNTSDWINLIAAILVGGGTLFLGIMAWRTIRQTRSIQKAEKKERLLNEIIEWAEDIRQSSSESIAPNRIILGDPTMQIAPQMGFLQLQRKSQELNKKSVYMKEAIAKVFGGSLLSSVEKVLQKLDETIEVISDCLTRKAKENSEKVEEYKKSLDSYAEDLIKEATKIKTGDIS